MEHYYDHPDGAGSGSSILRVYGLEKGEKEKTKVSADCEKFILPYKTFYQSGICIIEKCRKTGNRINDFPPVIIDF